MVWCTFNLISVYNNKDLHAFRFPNWCGQHQFEVDMNFDTKVEGAKIVHLSVKHMCYYETKYTVYSVVVSGDNVGALFKTTPTLSLHEG